MNKVIGHLRSNVVAYLALFVALGGTGYAAVNLPAGSVGTRQLHDGAVTAKKLDGSSIAGYVAFWARIGPTGNVVASSKPVVATGWGPGGGLGFVTFRGQLPRRCFPLAEVTNDLENGGGAVTEVGSGSFAGKTSISVLMRNLSGQMMSEPVVVAEICP
jgi:hypothetical protein